MFKCRLKDDIDDNCLTVTGRLFHASGPATEKDVHQLLSLFEIQLIDHQMPTVVLSDECSSSLAYRALAGSLALRCGIHISCR